MTWELTHGSLVMLCQPFRHFEEEDEYCPHCDNKFIVEAKTPQMGLGIEGHDERMGER